MKIGIVTGASSGLGREFVYQLSQKKALDEIWVIARREERLKSLQEQVETPLRLIPLDLTKRASFQKLESFLNTEQPDVRILINAAGFGKIGAWKDISLTDCDDMIDLNCRAAVNMTQLVLPHMNKGAQVLEICSTAGFQPFPYLGIYSASKAFLYRYSRALRVELFGTGISVTAVCPYWIKDTEFIAKAQKTRDSSYIRHFPLASKEDAVVKRALRDAQLRLAVSTPGVTCAVHRIIAKFVPSEIMMGAWALIRRV